VPCRESWLVENAVIKPSTGQFVYRQSGLTEGLRRRHLLESMEIQTVDYQFLHQLGKKSPSPAC